MSYRINELARLSGLSTRALRYYDSIGLLTPETIDQNGYRLYGQRQVDILQQIMFYRELEFPLANIKCILSASDYDRKKALESQLAALKNRKARIDRLIENVTKTIASTKGDESMTDSEKFECFKKKTIEENENKYGHELRERFGPETIDASNKKMASMDKESWNSAQQLSELINKTLLEAFATGDPAGEASMRLCRLHRQWLCMMWGDGTYTKEAHLALAEGYVADERFTAYYDSLAPGCTKFLRDAIAVYCKK